MISDAQYNLIRNVYSATDKPRTTDDTGTYNRLLKCYCGHWMTGERHIKKNVKGVKVYHYYRCVHHAGPDRPSYISTSVLEKQVIAYLGATMLKPHYVSLYVKLLNIRNVQKKELRDIQL
jgi:hypothetical protein